MNDWVRYNRLVSLRSAAERRQRGLPGWPRCDRAGAEWLRLESFRWAAERRRLVLGRSLREGAD